MDLRMTIANFVEEFLPRFTEDKAMLLTVEISFDIYGDTRKHVRYFPKFVFYRPSNYTRVLYLLDDSPFNLIQNDMIWELISDHDSAWREDGLRNIFTLRMEARNEIEAFALKHGFKLSDVSESTYVSDVTSLTIEKQKLGILPTYNNRKAHIVSTKGLNTYRIEAVKVKGR